jgi:hypothetical protein
VEQVSGTHERILRSVAFVFTLAALGCGDSEDDPVRPDTGYGAGLTPPPTVNCGDLCIRLGDCAAQLCNEDSHSTRYSGAEDLLVAQCETRCSDQAIQADLNDQEWRCAFESSCRQVFDYDVCQTRAFYTCL